MGILGRFVAGAGEGLADVGKQMLRTADDSMLLDQRAKIDEERQKRINEFQSSERVAAQEFQSGKFDKEMEYKQSDLAARRGHYSDQGALLRAQAGESGAKAESVKRISDLQRQYLELTTEEKAGPAGESIKSDLSFLEKSKTGKSGNASAQVDWAEWIADNATGPGGRRLTGNEVLDVVKSSTENPHKLALELYGRRISERDRDGVSPGDRGYKDNETIMSESVDAVRTIGKHKLIGVGTRAGYGEEKSLPEKVLGGIDSFFRVFGGGGSLSPETDKAITDEVSSQSSESGILTRSASAQPSEKPNLPPAPRNPADRVIDQEYLSPDGRIGIWKGDRWQLK